MPAIFVRRRKFAASFPEKRSKICALCRAAVRSPAWMHRFDFACVSASGTIIAMSRVTDGNLSSSLKRSPSVNCAAMASRSNLRDEDRRGRAELRRVAARKLAGKTDHSIAGQDLGRERQAWISRAAEAEHRNAQRIRSHLSDRKNRAGVARPRASATSLRHRRSRARPSARFSCRVRRHEDATELKEPHASRPARVLRASTSSKPGTRLGRKRDVIFTQRIPQLDRASLATARRAESRRRCAPPKIRARRVAAAAASRNRRRDRLR